MQIDICSITFGLHLFLAFWAWCGVLDLDAELVLLLLGSQPHALAASRYGWLKPSLALWSTAILGYVLSYGDNGAEQVIGVLAVHLAGGCCLVPDVGWNFPWKIWPILLQALVISSFTVVTPIQMWDTQLLYLCTELETLRDYNQVLLQSLPFSKVATCRLRGCPSLFNVTSDADLQMNLMSANNPVVVESSTDFDQLFGRQMTGLSLDKSWVTHHVGRQQLKGIFCHDKPEDDLNIAFVDADRNNFECRVLVPQTPATSPKEVAEKKGTSREVLVGFCLVGSKKPRLCSNMMVKSRSLPERKSPRSSIVRLNKLPLAKPPKSPPKDSDQSVPFLAD